MYASRACFIRTACSRERVTTIALACPSIFPAVFCRKCSMMTSALASSWYGCSEANRASAARPLPVSNSGSLRGWALASL